VSVGHVEFAQVWKRFRYGEVHSRLRDAIPALAGRLVRRRRDPLAIAEGEFWALRDVSFEVKPGESLGVIGPNGAGKSTILKLLTGIMAPTAGWCRIRGRVGALIEVAAGFHPDLTGRENLFLQGVIMGMPRLEVARKFDEIVAFAELSSFIDTPVKRYSTGMEARLGFAIAAHLEPDVLLVDEVLAVGDAAFQARAFEKVNELVKREIPVVIVTHQLEAIPTLCTQAILLDRGRVIKLGTPQACIGAYLHGESGARAGGSGDGALQIEGVRLSSTQVGSGELLHAGLQCRVVEGRLPESESVYLRVRLAETGAVAFETGTFSAGVALPAAGRFQLTFELTMNLHPGVYLLETYAWDRARGRESCAGPSTYLEIRGAPFPGYAQCHPRVRVEPNPVAGQPA
jgi:ABC-type polysaccharide/polyol phosphate transport system ATPase subunit